MGRASTPPGSNTTKFERNRARTYLADSMQERPLPPRSGLPAILRQAPRQLRLPQLCRFYKAGPAGGPFKPFFRLSGGKRQFAVSAPSCPPASPAANPTLPDTPRTNTDSSLGAARGIAWALSSSDLHSPAPAPESGTTHSRG